MGVGNSPYEMEIDHDDDILFVKRFIIVEWGDDRITSEDILLDGTEMKSEFFNAPRISTATFDEEANSVKISSTVKFDRGGRTFEMKSSEEWSLGEEGNILKIVQKSTGFRGGENIVTLVFEKQQ